MWQVLVLLRIFLANIVASILVKRITGLPSRTRRLVWQFGFAFLFSLALAGIAGSSLSNSGLLVIAGIGIINSFGAYCQWKAIDISLSKTSLFTQADDLIAISLAFLFLGEWKSITPFLGFGIVLCVAAVISFSVARRKDDSAEKSPRSWKHLAKWIACYSIIWGVAMFSMRYFAIEEVPLPSFLAAWYGGSFFGALLVRFLAGRQEMGEKLTLRAIGQVSVLAALVWASLLLTYAIFQRVSIVVAQPIFQVTEMVFPVIIGLWVFKERKQLTSVEKAIFLAGLLGAVVIGLGF
ncbi:MAG: hypothetical protein HYS60_01250 [Candidatus Wildermuthbacteria bacterium]|nr:hypothetical protein [Candidatus Wildermuthbacteria bacterium]